MLYYDRNYIRQCINKLHPRFEKHYMIIQKFPYVIIQKFSDVVYQLQSAPNDIANNVGYMLIT